MALGLKINSNVTSYIFGIVYILHYLLMYKLFRTFMDWILKLYGTISVFLLFMFVSFFTHLCYII